MGKLQLSPSGLRRYAHDVLSRKLTNAEVVARATPAYLQLSRPFANVQDPDRLLFETWFTGTAPRSNVPGPEGFGGDGHKPPDERTLKLGKTIRVLHERLPNLLASPLPTEILSPTITLHLFPSTHPHLPTVSGRIAYLGALWAAPVAWGRVPVVGNVKLDILSERMIKNGHTSHDPSQPSEKLIVKWRTCKKANGDSPGFSKIRELLGSSSKEEDDEFTGIFVFCFDEKGRISSHTIEHVEEGGNWDRMTRVISVTDWLLGKAWGRRSEEIPGFALGYCKNLRNSQGRVVLKKRRDANG